MENHVYLIIQEKTSAHIHPGQKPHIPSLIFFQHSAYATLRLSFSYPD